MASAGARPEVAVLTVLGRGTATTREVVAATGLAAPEVQRVLGWAVSRGLADSATSGGYGITERGRVIVDLPELFGTAPTSGTRIPGLGVVPVDLATMARRAGELGQHARQGRDAVRERAGAARLVDLAAREDAVGALNLHYVNGLLDLDERERRVGIALAATHRGDLIEALAGLPRTTGPSTASRVGTAVGTATRDLTRTMLAVAAAGAVLAVVLTLVIVLILLLSR